jgi:hypothetical protein
MSVVYLGALLSAGAFGVHQLRYLVGYGEHADAALTASGHDYLTFVEPLIGLLLAFAVAHIVWRLAGGAQPGPAPSRRRLALAFGFALLTIYVGQELLEGELATGHASGLEGVFGSGGWAAVPLALSIGAALTFAVRLVDDVAGRLRLTGVRTRSAGPTALAVRVVDARLVPRSSPLARHVAGRAPPHLSH